MVTDTAPRRAQQRYGIEIPIEVRHEGAVIATTTQNISLGGMFIGLTEPLPFGAKVHLVFSLPDLPEPLEVDAHVRWLQAGVGVGVQFAGLRAREVWALQRLFAAHE